MVEKRACRLKKEKWRRYVRKEGKRVLRPGSEKRVRGSNEKSLHVGEQEKPLREGML